MSPKVLGVEVRQLPHCSPCLALDQEKEERITAQLELLSELENVRIALKEARAEIRDHTKRATASAWWSSGVAAAVLGALVTGALSLFQVSLQARIQKSSEVAVENREKTVEQRMSEERRRLAEQRKEDIREAIRAANAERDRQMVVHP